MDWRIRSIVATFTSVIFMLGLFLIWHTLLIHDFRVKDLIRMNSLQYVLPCYIFISAIFYFLIYSKVRKVNQVLDIKAIMIWIGSAIGCLVLFRQVEVWEQGSSIEFVVLDFVWQLVEQGLGVLSGYLICLVLIRIKKYHPVI